MSRDWGDGAFGPQRVLVKRNARPCAGVLASTSSDCAYATRASRTGLTFRPFAGLLSERQSGADSRVIVGRPIAKRQ